MHKTSHNQCAPSQLNLKLSNMLISQYALKATYIQKTINRQRTVQESFKTNTVHITIQKYCITIHFPVSVYNMCCFYHVCHTIVLVACSYCTIFGWCFLSDKLKVNHKFIYSIKNFADKNFILYSISSLRQVDMQDKLL